ncbi:beta-propeller domain-containing protein [Methanolapillus africanus]|uniref:beta-propeller domain-containing protein n=1 Tax=Methanolapillus africanus TaxID=3028297 RepID=UPI0030B8D5EE
MIIICSILICLYVSQPAEIDNRMVEKVGMTTFESESQMNDYFKNSYIFNNVRPVSSSSLVRTPVWYDRTPYSYNTSMISLILDSSDGSVNEKPLPNPAATEPLNATRFSETNVQVENVDEADLIKTDGNIIYYTPLSLYQKNITFVEEPTFRYYQYEQYLKTFTIDAMPPESMTVLSEIDRGGDLYLVNDTLIAITDKNLGAYNVSDPKNPVLIWSRNLDGMFSESRMVNGKLYLVVTKQNMNGSNDDYVNETVNPGGPMIPVGESNSSENSNGSNAAVSNAAVSNATVSDTAVSPVGAGNTDYPTKPWTPPTYMGQKIDYRQCYYPVEPSVMTASARVVYFVSAVDISNGNFDDTIAFVGSNSTLLYASADNLYLTNYFIPNYWTARDRFFLENGSKYYPKEVMNDYKNALGDGSTEESREKANQIFDTYLESISESDAEQIFRNYEAGFSAHIVNLIKTTESTSISRINLKDFSVTTGVVPGAAGNQFFMDEHDGNFRVATTLGTYLRLANKVNVVYVLNKRMNVIGYTPDLAWGESIKSTNYDGDRLYMVTYAEKDPFFVIDLKNPRKPSVLGVLELPGFSTYLYPVNETSVIGLGYTNDGKMKLTLFDVTYVLNPQESGSVVFNVGKSAALSDHHAFMWDPDRSLLVLPTGEHAYVMEIKDGNIALVKDDVHENATVIRSIYINNYLYTFSEKEIHVLNQDDWALIKKIEIPQPATFTDPKTS